MQRQTRRPSASVRPFDPFGYFIEEVAFQLDFHGVALTEDVRAAIASHYVAGVSPVAAVALMLGIPRDDSP